MTREFYWAGLIGVTEPPEVLFVCVHNAGRSQMAAALLDHHGRRYLDWDLDDPAGKGPDDVRAIRDEIDRRVRALLADLLRD